MLGDIITNICASLCAAPIAQRQSAAAFLLESRMDERGRGHALAALREEHRLEAREPRVARQEGHRCERGEQHARTFVRWLPLTAAQAVPAPAARTLR
eukprot:scaffold20622_cov69-Phaeocystis_antarctica.AAC.1